MIIHAYPKFYLRHAQAALGDAFDYAINTCGITGRDFIQMFVVSSVSKRMENGEPAYLVGKSGIEIALEVVAETKGQELQTESTERMYRSAEYFRRSLLKRCKRCTTRSTKRMSQNLQILRKQGSKNVFPTPT